MQLNMLLQLSGGGNCPVDPLVAGLYVSLQPSVESNWIQIVNLRLSRALISNGLQDNVLYLFLWLLRYPVSVPTVHVFNELRVWLPQ